MGLKTVQLLAALVALQGLAEARAGFVVVQVEAKDSSGRYAPVDYNGTRVLTRDDAGTGTFDGLKFFADSGLAATGTDVSVHARDVANEFYGSGSPGRPYVSTVRTLTSDDLLNRYLRPVTRRGIQLPAKLPGGSVKVLNASFAGSTGTNSLDNELLGRTDFLINRDNVFITAGAVSSTTGTFQGASLLWGARNVLAVRGSAAESVFDPSQNMVGRRYADVWDFGTASSATGRVASVATALIGEATAAKRTGATKPVAIRALLLAGADRSAAASGIAAWTREQPNGLDTDLGAGRVDLEASRDILTAPAPKFASVSGLTLRGPYTTDPVPGKRQSGKLIPTASAGLSDSWTMRPGQTFASLFQLSSDTTGVTAALTWNTVLRTAAIGNLTLQLRPITITLRGDVELAEPLLSISAATDNVRFLTYDGTLAAGAYAWYVSNVGTETLSPALAFRLGGSGASFAQSASLPLSTLTTTSSPPPLPTGGFHVVPEPSGLAVLAVSSALALRRRPRRAATSA